MLIGPKLGGRLLDKLPGPHNHFPAVANDKVNLRIMQDILVLEICLISIPK